MVNQVILGLDPGYKTGCKWAIIDQNGEYVASGVIYLLTSAQSLEASKIMAEAIAKYAQILKLKPDLEKIFSYPEREQNQFPKKYCRRYNFFDRFFPN